MAQTTNRATTETDRPDRHDTQANRHGRQDTQQSRWGTRSDHQYEHRNRREYGSSRESDSGASTDWDYCSACGEPGHASRNCVARIREQLHLTNVTRETTRQQIVGVHQDKIAEATVLQGTTIPTTFCKITI